MSEKKTETTVTLISPNGSTVTVAESKAAERLATGYRLPEKKSAAKSEPAKQSSGASKS